MAAIKRDISSLTQTNATICAQVQIGQVFLFKCLITTILYFELILKNNKPRRLGY